MPQDNKEAGCGIVPHAASDAPSEAQRVAPSWAVSSREKLWSLLLRGCRETKPLDILQSIFNGVLMAAGVYAAHIYSKQWYEMRRTNNVVNRPYLGVDRIEVQYGVAGSGDAPLMSHLPPTDRSKLISDDFDLVVKDFSPVPATDVCVRIRVQNTGMPEKEYRKAGAAVFGEKEIHFPYYPNVYLLKDLIDGRAQESVLTDITYHSDEQLYSYCETEVYDSKIAQFSTNKRECTAEDILLACEVKK